MHCRLECVPDDNGLIGEITIGDNVSINDRVHIASASSVSIGSGCLIASNVYISDHDHTIPETVDDLPASTGLFVKRVTIGRNCWIGQNVNILKGVTLGEGCIVGSGAVVTSSFPDRTVIAGVPARAIRSLK
ncbi:hypothetical protein L1D40_20095 [Shewanella insulae]|uniref:DapH/DapD/GlmU-related protein n=1 Tax=Shewanella insulae TaxID=2681496 RepID=UPI001EFC7135|nr:DapH/DapD/GlmU-related protein [Shewanella insulae]MCG9757475.1 hypothetical protein [Shewanella insulae]